jgi:hypothetical protein
MEANNAAPEMEQPTLEELAGGDPELLEAMQKAQGGQWANTLVEIWEDTLNREAAGWAGEPSMDTYQAILQAWPFLGYHDVAKVRLIALQLTRESLDALDAAIEIFIAGTDKTKATVFSMNEDDWFHNRMLYLEIIAQWTALANQWGVRWRQANLREQPFVHAAVAICIAKNIGPNGLTEHIRHLKDFQSFGEEEHAYLSERLQFLIEGAGDE